MRRVVITGLGMVSPLACGVEQTWTRLLDGQSGAGPITRFDASHLTTTYACEVPRAGAPDAAEDAFNPDDWMEPKEQRKVDDFILYGMAAADQAIKEAGLADASRSINGRATPLKKWRCSKCWSRFGRPREERHPICAECRAGDATLFGPRDVLVPEHARPIAPRKRKRRTG
ncbi:hypothetical protein LCGC14_2085810 [marine sediment metagenome]|uniref:Beta-ketoacyl synthase-like N-terminal domain-containing protein n=1 Tax=marine sediment metagenome TaxID=412755 RepID=A0A0F9EEH5_9ZZZZ